MKDDITTTKTLKDVKHMQKARQQSSLEFIWTIIARLVFGIGSLVTSLLATLYVRQANLTQNTKYALYVCIAITLVPAVIATGKYLWDGLTSDVRKGQK